MTDSEALRQICTDSLISCNHFQFNEFISIESHGKCQIQFNSIACFLPPGIPLDQQEKDEIALMFKSHRLKMNEHFISEDSTFRLIGAVTKGIHSKYLHDQRGILHVDHFICTIIFYRIYVHEIIVSMLQERKDLDQLFQQGSRLESICQFNAYYIQWLTSIPH